jgi:squalene-hopene/tetraprenyl-beta-curcumene cyclase
MELTALQEENERLKQELDELRREHAERQRAEATLTADAAVLRWILDALPVGVTAVDENGRFIVFNRAVQEMAGRGAVSGGPNAWTERYGVFMPDNVTPYPPEELPITRALRGEIVDAREAVLRGETSRHETRIVTDARPLVDAQGVVRGAVAITRDVSSRRRQSLAPSSVERPTSTPRLVDAQGMSIREELVQGRAPVESHRALEPESKVFRDLDAQLRRAARYCLDTQDERGAWEVLPDARLFDTGLLAYALSSVPGDAAAPAVSAARRWLDRSSPQAHDRLALVLDETPRLILSRKGPIDLRAPALYSDVFRRKALLLYALAEHAGLEVLAPLSQEDVRAQVRAIYERRNAITLKQWSRVDLVSIYLILEHLTAAPGAASSVGEAVRYLESMQAADGSFCHNPVSSAIAFLALSMASPGSRAWERCLKHLLAAQQPDGTWRFCTSDVWDTSLTIRAFRDHPLFRAEALAPAVRFLAGSQNEDGGWGFRTDVESDNDTSSCALLALRELVGVEQGSALRAIRYLRAQQREDGLWNTWQSSDDHPVEDCVAHVVTALAPYEASHGLRLDPARDWLVRRFQETAQWSAGWYRNLPYSILEVGHGLRRAAPVAREAAASLIRLQNEDGGWPAEIGGNSRASSTGLALAALLDHFAPSEPFLRRGVRYLLETQRRDGTWPGQPELYGPRPLVYHLQTNTHAFASYGLMAAWRRVRSLSDSAAPSSRPAPSSRRGAPQSALASASASGDAQARRRKEG